ncbi:hypothetical protein KBC79_04300 [Candidatus Woesebacteria bacterium]|nr:hypothetical protein [Candidatus Woesebacteria bacterium]
MIEKQQDLGIDPEFTAPETHTFSSIAAGIAMLAIEETLDSGRMVWIPSLRSVITPERQMKKVSELSEDELKANPHILD